MSRKPRNIWHLILGVSGLSVLGWFTNSYPPTKPQYIIIFFLTVFLSVFFLSLFILKNTRLTVLLSSCLTVFLILRFLDLRSPLYFVLLLATLISLEFSLRRK